MVALAPGVAVGGKRVHTGRVKSREGLIQDQYVRIADQRSSQLYPLLVAQ